MTCHNAKQVALVQAASAEQGQRCMHRICLSSRPMCEVVRLICTQWVSSSEEEEMWGRMWRSGHLALLQQGCEAHILASSDLGFSPDQLQILDILLGLLTIS